MRTLKIHLGSELINWARRQKVNLMRISVVTLLLSVLISCSTEDREVKAPHGHDASLKSTTHGVILTSDDYKRMSDLKARSLSLINDMARITGKRVGRNLLPVGRFEITSNERGDRTQAIIEPTDDEILLGYYCDPPGICQSEPCGTAAGGQQLTTEERARMQTLKRNLFVNINDMARIMSSALGRNLLPVGKFSLSTNDRGDQAGGVIIEPIDDEILLGYYCDPPGVCQSEPCN